MAVEFRAPGFLLVRCPAVRNGKPKRTRKRERGEDREADRKTGLFLYRA
jgi:hypothetical protein